MEGITFYFDWEVKFMEWFQGLIGTPFGTTVFSLFTELGDQIIMSALFAFVYLCINKDFGRYIAVNLMLGLTWNPLIKNMLFRRRPYFDNPGIKCLKPVDADFDVYDISKQGFSFPSGHSTNSAVMYGSLGKYGKKKWLTVLAFVIPFLVGISRVALGNHYPTDVLVGWLLGIAIILVSSLLQKAIKKRWLLYLILFCTAIPGVFYCHTDDYFTGLGMLIGFFVADLFETKYVKFENTKSIPRIILRIAGAGAVFLGLSLLLKLPFSKEFLNSASAGEYAVRTARYAIVMFVTLGVFPMCFKYTANIGKKQSTNDK